MRLLPALKNEQLQALFSFVRAPLPGALFMGNFLLSIRGTPLNMNTYPNNLIQKKRRPIWLRAVDTFLRTCHIGVTGILFGGALFEVPFPQLLVWHHLAIGTGCALIISEIYHCPHWIYQGRGVMVLVHVGLLGIIHYRQDLMIPILTAVLAFGCIGSHMPKNLRYWSFIHGRVID
jgi:hypothetical protein